MTDDASADGGTVRREKSFRGISTRLAIHYLTNLGGERRSAGERDGGDADSADDGGDDAAEGAEDDDADDVEVVEGDGWRATLSSDSVGVGPSLDLTEVTVVFEGERGVIDPLVERFSQKAMRAGG
ncbi:hypothetical protein [Halegenticoccus soli]|uniref:hypothetical protein n=1 Tax=Halegenticoccus soli TaxID=1985678 RepID=UPI000C6DC79E|nr:hypothetical protein [Halegenticoccus soli]